MPLLHSVSVPAVLWFTPDVSWYHWENVAALVMWALAGGAVALRTGSPSAPSVDWTSPVMTFVSPLAPGSKSAGIWARKSRYSAGTVIWSPSIGCTQVNPGSTLQSAEHPSPLTLLPSSQASLTTRPSPQRDVQLLPVLHCGSFWHPAEQPSNGREFPSSQLSVPSTTLSPQVVWLHLLGVPLHFHPGSSLQVGEQPSPAVVFPSSHSSGITAIPSPQRATE